MYNINIQVLSQEFFSHIIILLVESELILDTFQAVQNSLGWVFKKGAGVN